MARQPRPDALPPLRPASRPVEADPGGAPVGGDAPGTAGPVRTAYALGVLPAGRRHAVEAARFAFSRRWRT